MTNEELEEWLENAIDDSFDLGWTSLDAAKLIVSRMRDEGLVIVKTEPVAELLPCPFCGEAASVFDDANHSTAWEAACCNSHCSAQPSVWGVTRAEAVTAWNTRAALETTNG
jgi:Lar family restriction alleviation protein